jgi:hypothetical protein
MDGMQMIAAHRVNSWITTQKPMAICDSCIVDAVNITPAQVAQITGALGTTSDFDRDKGVCAFCKNERTVIRAKIAELG